MFKPTRAIPIRAVVILSLFGPAPIPTADAQAAPIETANPGAGLTQNELAKLVKECLKLQSGLTFQMDVIGQPEDAVFGTANPVRNLFIIAFLNDPALAKFQKLGCGPLLASVGYS